MPARTSETGNRSPELRKARFQRIDLAAAENIRRAIYPTGIRDKRLIRRLRPATPSFYDRTERGMRLVYVWGLTLLFCLFCWTQIGHLVARLGR